MKKIQRWIPLTGFIILTNMVITLLIATVVTGLKSQITGGSLSIIVLVGVLININRKYSDLSVIESWLFH